MQPQYGNAATIRRIPRWAWWLVGLLIILSLGWFIYYAQSFHVVRTDPKTSAFSSDSPFFKIYFSRELSGTGYSVSSSDNLVTSERIEGKVLILDLDSNPSIGKTYSIQVKNISSKDGAKIENKTFRFTVKQIPFSKLSKDQQDEILRNQDKPVYEVSSIEYENFDELLANGMPSAQYAALKQSLVDYSDVIDQKFWTMTLTPGSVSVAPYNPASADSTSTVYFTVILGDATYVATVRYDTLQDTLTQLVLTDQAGATKYDSLSAGD